MPAIKHPLLFGGQSSQPDHVKFPHQVRLAKNAQPDVRDGLRKRPGSKHLAEVDGLGSGDYQLHPIVRDSQERYLVLFGRDATQTVLKVFDDLGRECTLVVEDSDAWDYLQEGDPTSKDIKLCSAQDTTFLCNRNATPQMRDLYSFPTAGSFSDYDEMTRSTPTLESVSRARESSPNAPAGYYQYHFEDSATFAQWVSPNLSGSWDSAVDLWDDPDKNPSGFLIKFRDKDGVDKQWDVVLDFESRPPGNMHEVAKRITQAMQDAGAHDALCAWEPAAGYTGNLVITSPYRGAGSQVVSIVAPTDTDLYDLTSTTRPFCFAEGTSVPGTGTTSQGTIAVDQRWRRHAISGDRDFAFENGSMPVQLQRTQVGDAMTPATFTLKLCTWQPRYTGSVKTNPAPKPLVEGKPINDISIFQNRLVLLSDTHVILSQTGDLFNLFIGDVGNITDADPIDIAIGTNHVAIGEHVVTHRDRLTVVSKSGQQFEIHAAEPLTPTNASVTIGNGYQTVPIRPQLMGSSLFMPVSIGGMGGLVEIGIRENQVSTKGDQIGAQVEGMVPEAIRAMSTFPASGMLAMLPELGGDQPLFVYKQFYEGENRRQSAWCEYHFPDSWDIHACVDLDDEMVLLVDDGNAIQLFTLAASNPDNDQAMGRHIHADHKTWLQGVHASGTTTWTLPVEGWEPDTLILANGQAVEGFSQVGDTVTASGDHSGSLACFANTFEMRIELPQPYIRDEDNQSITSGWTQIREAVITHRNTMAYAFQFAMPNRPVRSWAFSADTQKTGEFRATPQGNVDGATLQIVDATVLPTTITGLQYQATHNEGT